MKTLTLLIPAVLLFACGGGDYGSPETTCETMAKAAEAKDKDAMLSCFCDETRKAFAEMEKLSEQMGSKSREDDWFKQSFNASDMEFGEEKIDGNKATVEVIREGRKDLVHLVKEGGDWKISVPEIQTALEAMKSMKGMMKGMMEGMTEGSAEDSAEAMKAFQEAMKKSSEKNNQ